MKQILFLMLMLMSINTIAQNKNLPKFRDMERCLDSNGDPIADCVPLSRGNGKHYPTPIGDLVDAINAYTESAIDSIYTSNDTLYIDYFNAPTLAYYAPGLNGIYGTSNNNKQSRVNTILYPSTGGGILEFKTLTTQLGRVIFNSPFNTPLSLYGQASQGYLSYGFPNASGRAIHTLVGQSGVDSRQWSFGAIGLKFQIRDQTALGVPRVSIDRWVNAPDTSLVIRENGDIKFGSYKLNRSPLNTFDNVAYWDDNGVFQKLSKQALIDTINANVSGGENFVNTNLDAFENRSHNFHGNDLTIDSIGWLQLKARGGIAEFVISNPQAFIGTNDGTLTLGGDGGGVNMSLQNELIYFEEPGGRYRFHNLQTDATANIIGWGSDGNLKKTNKTIDDLLPCKHYTALISQTGTNDPTAIVLENTLSGAVVWDRLDVGVYTATLAAAFPLDETFIPAYLQYAAVDKNDIRRELTQTDTNELLLDVEDTGVDADGWLNKFPIEIKVCPQ